MTDLVQRLREPKLGTTHTDMIDLAREAADELERVNALLERAVAVGERLGEDCKKWEQIHQETRNMALEWAARQVEQTRWCMEQYIDPGEAARRIRMGIGKK